MDRKIDLLYKAGLLGGQRGAVSDFLEEDDVDASLVRFRSSAPLGKFI